MLIDTPERAARPVALADIDRLPLAEIDAILESDEHYRRSATRNYGVRDPLDGAAELVFRCRCGATPAVHHGTPPPAALKRLSRPLPPSEGGAYHVQCPACSRVGRPSLREWRAVVDWNYEMAGQGPARLSDVPFFNFGGLPAAEVAPYLESIRYDLTLRRAQARKRREAGEDVGRRYVAKIDAYLGWVNVALRLLRAA